MRRDVGRLEGATLIDRDVDQNRPRPHLLHQLRADQMRGAGAGNQHGPDHEVGVRHHRSIASREDVRVWIRPVPDAVVRQPVDVLVHHDDLGSIPAAIWAALPPAIPPPSTTTLAGMTPEAPPIKTPRPPLGARGTFAPSCGAILPAISTSAPAAACRPSAVWTVS
jgi:hypothetical protein